jgi:hypothetical protein
MGFAGSAVSRQRSGNSLVMRSALCASLLTMSAFGIWHNSSIKISIMLFIKVSSFISPVVHLKVSD